MTLTFILTAAGVVLGLRAAAFVIFTDLSIESLVSRLFRRAGALSGAGPLTSSSRVEGSDLVLCLLNEGEDALNGGALAMMSADADWPAGDPALGIRRVQPGFLGIHHNLSP